MKLNVINSSSGQNNTILLLPEVEYLTRSFPSSFSYMEEEWITQSGIYIHAISLFTVIQSWHLIFQDTDVQTFISG